MENVLVCENPRCHFVLDRRINGTSLDGVQKIVKKCPACGSGWSSSCPYCDQPLAVNFADGHLIAACCGRSLADARAAHASV